jgi:hypothetical protein
MFLKIQYFLHKILFFEKSMFENSNISGINIISVKAAKVVGYM